jgi:hypothetical protein
MKWFRNLFKKKKESYPQVDKFKLCIIDENAKLLHDNLGITEERAEALTNLCIDAYKQNELLYQCLDHVVKGCLHTNEIVFSSMILYKLIDRYNAKDKLDNLLKNMFNND